MKSELLCTLASKFKTPPLLYHLCHIESSHLVSRQLNFLISAFFFINANDQTSYVCFHRLESSGNLDTFIGRLCKKLNRRNLEKSLFPNTRMSKASSANKLETLIGFLTLLISFIFSLLFYRRGPSIHQTFQTCQAVSQSPWHQMKSVS